MAEVLQETLEHTIEITLIIAVLMIIVEGLNILTSGKLKKLVTGGGWRQYVISAFLGATPGCSGSFVVVTFYVHGLISFGAITGAMMATSGDEAFVMLSMFPGQAILLFGLLFISGIMFGFITDWLVRKWNIQTCVNCELQQVHEEEKHWRHFFSVHVWKHLILNHLWKIAVWTFLALLVVNMLNKYFPLEPFLHDNPLLMFFLISILGLIPASGPHLFVVTMFAQGMIPFSILFTSSFIQDGHGLIPMLSYSIKDTILIKLFNVIFGLMVGLVLYMLGL